MPNTNMSERSSIAILRRVSQKDIQEETRAAAAVRTSAPVQAAEVARANPVDAYRRNESVFHNTSTGYTLTVKFG